MIKLKTHLLMGKKRYEVVQIWTELHPLLERLETKIKVEAVHSTESEAKGSQHTFQLMLIEPLIKNGSIKVVNDD